MSQATESLFAEKALFSTVSVKTGKALSEHMSSGFASRADIVAACRYVRFVPKGDI
jgi:hypothetical protein